VGTHPKPAEGERARELRRELGLPMKQIAALLGVSVSSVSLWTREIELTPEQRHRNTAGNPHAPQNPRAIAARARTWAARNRQRRREYQEEGRLKAREGDPLHIAGCMLYWAEGYKNKNTLMFANSDPHMLTLFARFLRISLNVSPEQMTLRLNVYTGNGLSVTEIEDHWLRRLELPRGSLRGHTINHTPTSSSGKKKNRLPYGVAQLRVLRSTRYVQHILGAIQEYGAFSEPRWLDAHPSNKDHSKSQEGQGQGAGNGVFAG
jgi:hypothetical protein